ncbi:hypothetical protein ACH0AH_01025 [Microbacterium paludicola]|uniref:hypothetical protein n=1 Tax=Microbacterium paludicola TaxID=300019 RepID=UPI00387969AF
MKKRVTRLPIKIADALTGANATPGSCSPRAPLPRTAVMRKQARQPVPEGCGAVLFAVGLTRGASVVARRPVGVIAIALLAAWTLFDSMLSLATPAVIAGEAFGYVSMVVPFGAALVASDQISRARTVPSPWRRAPMWVLAVQTLAWGDPQIALANATQGGVLLGDLLAPVGLISLLLGTVGLGTVAVALAAKQRPSTVQVFRSFNGGENA